MSGRSASDPELIVCALKTGALVIFSGKMPFREIQYRTCM
jgi:hypothetical protein